MIGRMLELCTAACCLAVAATLGGTGNCFWLVTVTKSVQTAKLTHEDASLLPKQVASNIQYLECTESTRCLLLVRNMVVNYFAYAIK